MKQILDLHLSGWKTGITSPPHGLPSSRGPSRQQYSFNENDAFPRRLIVRVVDESTAQDRMAVLMLLRDFMMRPENNRYGYEYQVNETSDLTPQDAAALEPANAYIPDNSIVNLITAMYENVDDGWFAHNQETATEYFADAPYPRYAVEQLGYPDAVVPGENQFAAGFNPPIND